VLGELRRGDMLPRRVRQVARKISNTIRQLENAGEAPSEQQLRMNEPPGRLNFSAGSASLFVAEWTTLPHGQG